MNEPVKYEIFFTELDYPKFLALFPDKFPPTYDEFVARVNQRIEQRAEQITIEKANVGYVKFIAECKRCGETPNYHRPQVCAFHVWGSNNGFRQVAEF